MIMKRLLYTLILLAALSSCDMKPKGDFIVTVKNPADVERIDEMVEIPMSDLLARMPLISEEEMYVVCDEQARSMYPAY